MHQTSYSILSITPGRNRLGVAVFRDGNLVYYAGKSLAQHRSMPEVRQAINKILNKMIENYCVEYLAIMELNKQQRTSHAVVSIYEYIKTMTKRKHLAVCESDPVLIRRLICGNLKPTNHNVARQITSRYIELSRHLIGNNGWEHRYYRFVFNAIAVGEVWARDLGKNTAVDLKSTKERTRS